MPPRSRHKMPDASGIYMIFNLVNDKYYIGSAVNIRLRINFHFSQLDRGVHDNAHLQHAWKLYGDKSFICVVLGKISKENLEAKEQYWIDLLKASNPDVGYNIRKIANSNQGYKHTDEAKKKVGDSKRGKPRSEETKEKLRLANIGKKQSADTIEKRSNSMKGRVYTDEHRANMSASMKGLKRSAEAKINISNAFKGRKASPETRLKQSEAGKLRWQKYHEAKQRGVDTA